MAQKPIGYYGEFRPTGVDQSAARRFEALAGLADQVGDIAFQIGAKRAEKIGAEKGEKAGRAAAERLAKPQPEVGPPEDVEPPKTKEGFLASMSIEAQAYNTAMQSSFLSSVSEDAKTGIERLAIQYPDDVQAFQINVQKYIQGLLEGVGPEYKDVVEATINDYVARSETQVFKNEIAKNRTNAKNNQLGRLTSLSNEAAKLMSEGDEEGATSAILERNTIIQSLLTTEDITPEEAANYQQKTSERIETQRQVKKVKDFIFDPANDDETNLQRARQALETFRESDFPDQTPESLERIEASIRGEIAEFEAQINGDIAAKTQANALAFSNLQIAAINNLQPSSESRQQADSMLENNAITASQRTQIYNATYRQDETRTAKAQAMSRVSERLGGDTNAIPDQSDVNTYYEANIDLYNANPNKIDMQVELISSTRQIPTAIKNEFDGKLTSSDINEVQQAIELLDKVEQIPGMFGRFASDQDKAMLLRFAQLADVMTAREAAVEARKITDPNNNELRVSREAAIKKEKFADNYESWTIDILGAMNPTSMAKATRQMEVLFETGYMSGMTANQAEEQAKNGISKIWSLSPDFGYMQYAPEQFNEYVVNGSTAYIKDQLYADIQKNFAFATPIKMNDMFLMSDDHTAKTAAMGQPEYLVIVRDENGQLIPIQDELGNLYFKPNVQIEREKESKRLMKLSQARRQGQMTSEERQISRQFAQGL